jgi:hypothetical protein
VRYGRTATEGGLLHGTSAANLFEHTSLEEYINQRRAMVERGVSGAALDAVQAAEFVFLSVGKYRIEPPRLLREHATMDPTDAKDAVYSISSRGRARHDGVRRRRSTCRPPRTP